MAQRLVGLRATGDSYIRDAGQGYRIVLRAGTDQYFYHGADGRPPFRCDRPDPGGAVDGIVGQ